jgi:hypothetical protein
MNDFVEGRFAASIMRASIERAYALEPNEFVVQLFVEMRKQLAVGDLAQVFVLSFTTDGDEPSMWRLYADRGKGFSFAIRLHTALAWALHKLQGVVLKCAYGEREVQLFCANALAAMRDIYISELESGVIPDPAIYAQLFLNNIAWLAPAFKPEIWKDEREWRFIFVRPPEEHKKHVDGRTFIELPLVPDTEEKITPISAICGGPLVDYEDDILPLQKVLFENGYGAGFPVHVAKTHIVRPGRKPPTFLKRD